MINHAPILSPVRVRVFNWLDIKGGRKDLKGLICRKTKYLFGCIFCVSFWITVVLDFKNCLYVPILASIITNTFLKTFYNKN
jgi:hypothetical protein